MAFVPAPNCVQVEIRWLLDSQKCENRFFVDVNAAPTDLLIESVGGVVESWITDHYLPLFNGAVRVTEVVITDWTVQLGIQDTFPIDAIGLTTGPMLPNESSFCVSLRTNSRGRSARGRWFMPPPDEAARLGINHVTATYATAAVAALQTLMNALDTAGFAMVVVQFTSNKVKLTTGVPRRYLSAVSVDDLLDSQRRRKPGNGS